MKDEMIETIIRDIGKRSNTGGMGNRAIEEIYINAARRGIITLVMHSQDEAKNLSSRYGIRALSLDNWQWLNGISSPTFYTPEVLERILDLMYRRTLRAERENADLRKQLQNYKLKEAF